MSRGACFFPNLFQTSCVFSGKMVTTIAQGASRSMAAFKRRTRIVSASLSTTGRRSSIPAMRPSTSVGPSSAAVRASAARQASTSAGGSVGAARPPLPAECQSAVVRPSARPTVRPPVSATSERQSRALVRSSTGPRARPPIPASTATRASSVAAERPVSFGSASVNTERQSGAAPVRPSKIPLRRAASAKGAITSVSVPAPRTGVAVPAPSSTVTAAQPAVPTDVSGLSGDMQALKLNTDAVAATENKTSRMGIKRRHSSGHQSVIKPQETVTNQDKNDVEMTDAEAPSPAKRMRQPRKQSNPLRCSTGPAFRGDKSDDGECFPLAPNPEAACYDLGFIYDDGVCCLEEDTSAKTVNENAVTFPTCFDASFYDNNRDCNNASDATVEENAIQFPAAEAKTEESSTGSDSPQRPGRRRRSAERDLGGAGAEESSDGELSAGAVPLTPRRKRHPTECTVPSPLAMFSTTEIFPRRPSWFRAGLPRFAAGTRLTTTSPPTGRLNIQPMRDDARPAMRVRVLQKLYLK